MQDIININDNNNLNFGCHQLDQKSKEVIIHNGIEYKVKTHHEITRLERDELMIFESVPGTTVSDFSYTSEKICFDITGFGNTSIIVATNQDKKYKLLVDDEVYLATNVLAGGKIQFIIDFEEVEHANVKLIKEI